ncbi:MAG: DNA-processing protein DprA [Salinibacterium sp.]|nr:DNA-processing protein DprA [Salinibacterium sp.]
MTLFGFKEAEVAELVRAVSIGTLDRDAIENAFARAMWTGIAEPGDRVAGQLVDQLGPARALAALVERRPAGDIASSELSVADAQQALDRWMPRLQPATMLQWLRQGARYGARLVTPVDDSWPSGFADLRHHGPIALWTRGRPETLAALSNSIALVGARAATGYGEHVAMEASAGLVDRGFAIVSGAAYGIDGMAHRAALASRGHTIAFLAGGVDRFYPSGHDALLNRIVENGLVASELPCGSAPTRWRFLQRNRLIAAASLATVVLEAGWRSGSLNTAHHANDAGRPVGAVPGPVTSAASAGCHKLIRDGVAELVTTTAEMAELVGVIEAGEPESRTRENTRVLDAVSARVPRSPDDIAARAGLTVAETQSELARLEVEGVVRGSERGWTKRGTPREP